MKKIAIVGPGAVASVVAWHLARAGLAPTIVAREATASLIAREGLTVVHADGEDRVSIAATSDPHTLGHQDFVLVGFKAHDWITGLDSVRPLIGPDTIVAPMLNGVPWWFFQGFRGAHASRTVAAVDPDGALAATLPPEQIAGCVVYLASARERPNRMRWNGRKRLVFGSPLGVRDARIAALVALLTSAGIEAEESADIRRDLWIKLLGNVTYNPLAVVTGATMDRMGSHEPFRRIVRQIMEEAVDVARALGVLDQLDIEERMRMSPLMKNVKPSTLQDYEAGRPLELGAIVDAVVELGALVDIPTPMTAAIGALAAERARVRDGTVGSPRHD